MTTRKKVPTKKRLEPHEIAALRASKQAQKIRGLQREKEILLAAVKDEQRLTEIERQLTREQALYIASLEEKFKRLASQNAELEHTVGTLRTMCESDSAARVETTKELNGRTLQLLALLCGDEPRRGSELFEA